MIVCFMTTSPDEIPRGIFPPLNPFVSLGASTWGHHLELWIARLVLWYRGSQIKHVQIAFPLENGTTITFSVDNHPANGMRVFEDQNKGWRSSGWEFYEMSIRRSQREIMIQKARSLIDKPFNTLNMYMFNFWPQENTGEAFFCVELFLTIAHAALLYTQFRVHATRLSAIYEFTRSQYKHTTTTTPRPPKRSGTTGASLDL
jgi:hypothetical protein